MNEILDLFLHLDEHLARVISQYGTLTYGILFAIIFAETGLVVTPFLPGDSLLFAAGALSRGGDLNIGLLMLLLFIAAVLGDALNYHVGQFFGERLFKNPNSRFLKRQHLDQTHAFFEKHGGKAIIIARFVPIVRTFAPFVAGMGSMTYSRFLLFNVVGAVLWVGICAGGGYLFAGIPGIKGNFKFVALGIIIVSLVPVVVEFLNHRRRVRAQA